MPISVATSIFYLRLVRPTLEIEGSFDSGEAQKIRFAATTLLAMVPHSIPTLPLPLPPPNPRSYLELHTEKDVEVLG